MVNLCAAHAPDAVQSGIQAVVAIGRLLREDVLLDGHG